MRRAVVLLAVAALVLAACSGGGGGRKAERPRRGGVLRIGVEKPRSLDPAQAGTRGELLVADQLFDSLTAYDPVTSAVVPSIASKWAPTPDQLHWDFTLRPDVRFANGRQITSADVKYTLERIAQKGSTSPVALQLEPVTGYKAFNADGTAPGLSGITTPAPDVVHVDLDQPLSSLPAVLGNPAFGIVPRESVEAKPPLPTFADQPVGSGPFVVRSRTADLLHLVPSPGSPALVAGVDVSLEPDVTASYRAFAAGQLDWSLVPPGRAGEVSRTRGRVDLHPLAAELFYGFNVKSPKLADPRFREAITRAVDRDAIVRAVYVTSARATTGLVPDGVPGHQDDPCGDRCRHDLTRAKALVSDTFGTNPVPEIQIDFDADDPAQQAIARAVQANLRDVGIPSALRSHPYADYLKFVVSGQEELFRLGSIGAYPTQDAYLAPLFTSGVADNVTGFASGAVDQLLKSARSEPDEAKRVAAYRDAEHMILEQLPVVPIAQFETQSISAPRVRELVVSAMGSFDASRVWLAATSSSR